MSRTRHSARLVITTLASGLALLATAAPAAAQQADDEDEALAPVAQQQGPTRGRYEDILVTARKVEESLQDVPLAITAFSAADIEEAGIQNLDDVANLTPNLSFFNAQGEFLPVPVIRGIVPTDIFGENNAAIFVDGVYVSGREGLNFNQLDLERIEVVRGPQSALYGRNAFSGAINYVTKRPTDELDVKAEATGGNDGRILGSVAVSGPILGTPLRGRIAAAYDEFNGSYDNALAPDTDIGGFRYRSFQGGLAWDPTDTLSIYLQGYYSNDEIDDAATTGVPANCEPDVTHPPNNAKLRNVCGELEGIDGADIAKLARAQGEDRDLIRSSLNIDWELDAGTLTFLTGYSNTEQQALVDGNRSVGRDLPFVYCNQPSTSGIPGFCDPNSLALTTTGLLQIEYGDETEEISQEIRFTSPQDRPFRYKVGGIWYNVDVEAGDGGVVAASELPPDAIGLGPFVSPFPTAIIPLGSDDSFFGRWFSSDIGDLDPLQRLIAENEVTGWRLFSGVDIDVTESVTLHAELGYTEEEKENRFIEWDETDLTNPDPIVDIRGKETFEQWTGRVGADWKFTDQWMTYFSIAKGEKPGGFTVFNATATDPGTGNTIPIAEQVPFDPEEIIAYELGVKGTAFDQRVRLDLSTFINDWTDIVLRQTTDTDPGTGLPLDQPQAINVNSADSTVWGFELDTSVFFTENLSGRVAVGYTNAEIDNAVLETVAEFPSFAPDGDVSGNELLRQPEWSASASLSYERPLVGEWDWYTRADVSWQDEVFIGLDNQSYLPDRTLANFKLGVRTSQLSLEFWVRNLFDDDSPTAAYRDVFFNNTDQGAPPFPAGPISSTFFDIFPFRYTVSHPRLRTWGVTARVRFGESTR